MTKERFTKIFTFMTSGLGVLVLGHGLVSHIVKIKSFFLLMSIDQTKWIYINDEEKEWFTITVIFMTSGAGVLVEGMAV